MTAADYCACPGCGRSFLPRFSEQSGEYRLCYCPGCGLGFFLPLKFPGPEYYETQGGSYAALHGQAVPLSPWHQVFFRRPPPQGELLDVGCGNGAFLEAAARAGFRCHGIDFDRRSVEFARRERGLDVEAAGLEEYVRQGRLFDVVTLFEVLEHQTDPAGFLRSVYALLRPGGLLCGTVPNRRRLRWWPMEDGEFPPNHFLRWDRRSLRVCLEGQGFGDVRLYTENVHNVRERLTGWAASWAKSKAAPASSAGAAAAPIRDLEKLGASAAALGSLSALRRARDAAFWPLGMLARVFGFGESLYFMARRGRERLD